MIFATMNPSGDFGKRELSPALRNRFTEIWVDVPTRKEELEQEVGVLKEKMLMGGTSTSQGKGGEN